MSISSVAQELIQRVGYFSGTPKALPDQPVPAVDPEVERLAHVLVDGLIARLAAEPAVPAISLLDNLGDQLRQAANLRRLGVVRRADPATAPATAPDVAASSRSPRRSRDASSR